MLELLADQTLFGLGEAETAELERLKNEFPEFKDDDSFERAAAAINLINLEITDSLPANLQAKLAAQAEEVFGATQKPKEFSSFEKSRISDSSKNKIADASREIPPKSTAWRWFGWAAVAAACLVIAITLWLVRKQPPPEIADASKTAPTLETTQTPELARVPEEKKSPETAEIPESAKAPKTGESNENVKRQETAKNPESNRNRENVKNPKAALQ